MELASTDLYRAKWSELIHDEWTSNLAKERPDIAPEKLQRRRQYMNDAVLDCIVEDFEEIQESLKLPDPDDRHVLAAAIKGKADAIVTFNLKDFPEAILERYDLEALHPDDFLKFQFDFDPATVVRSAKACRARLENPTIDIRDYLAILERQALPKFAAELKRFEAML